LSIKSTLSIYGELIKARQTILLLYTAVFSYLITVVELSQKFDWIKFVLLVLSLFLAVSGTTTINMYIDREIDAIMERTKDRPLPTGKVSPKTVIINGVILSFLGIFISYLFIGWLTSLVIFFGFFFDVIIYSLWLKKRTKFSIIFGGVAGGLPAMAGRVAIMGRLDDVGMYFLVFILAWIPVHILTLALIPENYDGYKAANVPMWPVVSTETQTMRVIAFGAIFSSLTLYRIAHVLGTSWIIRIVIGICTVILLYFVIKNMLKPSNKITFLIFKIASFYMMMGFLILYLGVIF
jgi:protoheme IX farnesyltransferase